MGTINKEWHFRHPMPDHPSPGERAEWHYEHALNCGCRAVTPRIAALLREHGFTFPEDQEKNAGPSDTA